MWPLAGCTAALELSSALGCSSLSTWASFSCACSRLRSQQVGQTCRLPLVHALHCCAAWQTTCSLDRLTRSVVLPALHGVV